MVNLRATAARIGYPRAVAVAFPRGASVGPPHRSDIQTTVLHAALRHLEGASKAGEIVNVPVSWPG
ncbi:MAG: hypothetical protein HY423_06505 [Candidatus Lambdaproteobacteria bacterium]|nr:hypothetical protein [Candidatus Lambdaproteobacteria bacterium]